VVKTNVHFPTDYNLLWDAARKCIEISCQLAEKQGLSGWRKASDWKKRIKRAFRKVQKVKKSGGKNKESRLGFAVGSYLELATTLTKKIYEFKSIAKNPSSISEINLQISLDYFHNMLDKHIDLVDRRLLQGQKIPHNEKVFSLFEPHTQWINKGKAGVVAELGQKHLIVTDQNHFIVHHQLIGSMPDIEMTIALTKKLKKQYGDSLSSISLDKGFSSNPIIEAVKPIHPNVIIKAKGKPTKARLEIEQSDAFKHLQNKHQAIESNINQLTYNGLNICRDKGEENFKKYVSLAVVSYNLHRLGNLIKKQLNAGSKKKARKTA